MLDYLLPAIFVLLAWWLSTGVVLYLNRLPPSTYRFSLLGATALLGLALYTVPAVAAQSGQPSVLLGFAQALAIWAWCEMTHFMGFLTGPVKGPCPPALAGMRRFLRAIGTSLHHELSVVLCGALLLLLTWGTANPVAGWAFLALWMLRWSAKLNLYLGVPNLHEDWIPAHLKHLTSYMRRRPMNILFPVSVTLASIGAALLWAGTAHAPTPASATGMMLVATLLALGALEHWFLVLPIQDSVLWNWAMKASEPGRKKRYSAGTRGQGPLRRGA